jgi:hypothetical protein
MVRAERSVSLSSVRMNTIHPTPSRLAMLALMLLVPLASHAGDAGRSSRLVKPNPFTEGTEFKLTMPQSSHIRIIVYDLLGREVRTLWEGAREAGEYPVPWDGNDRLGNPVVPGIYICVLYDEEVVVNSVKVVKVRG